MLLKKLKGFDERFFMYGEDIDLSYRTTLLGYAIDYVPQTSNYPLQRREYKER